MSQDPEDTCAFCGDSLPRRRFYERVVCDREECLNEARNHALQIAQVRRRRKYEEILKNRTHFQCPQCPPGTPPKPLDSDHFHAERRDVDGNVVKWMRWCKECKRRKQKERAVANREAELARHREAHARLNERRKNDPELDAVVRRRKAAQQRKWRQRNAEKVRESNRRYLERVKADPERLEAVRERDRMNERLRKEKKGSALVMVSQERWEKRHGYNSNAKEKVRVPVEPVAALIDMWLAHDEGEIVPSGRESANTIRALAEQSGVSERRIGSIKQREQSKMNLSTADKLCVALGTTFEDMYGNLDLAA